ncbi:manganese-dependent ADP-ribose/CDP-alcohol diphosphatase isoform X2 [Brachyhypopomus gauderio]|uniref:manganese-dependent ADP-ribose/CDP-alcohol diphosphatase isoform X2 n=1 Tax=Brachyhypopomus gauderio TaxID=698409 RepID=UPI0040413BAD
MELSSNPVFTFGVIADIQYADIDDGFNFHGTRKRYYRSSLQLLCNANRCWDQQLIKPSFILQLGDIIDGFNKKYGASERALQTVVGEFSNYSTRVHHVWGNHEFYNFSRSELCSSVIDSRVHCVRVGDGVMSDDVYAYHFSPAPNFRFVVLDSYDLSIIGREQSSEKYKKSFKLIKANNPNDNLNQPPGYNQWQGRFVKFNGGFSQDQLDWLNKVLISADKKEEKVIIAIFLFTPSPLTPYVLRGTMTRFSLFSTLIRVWCASWLDMIMMGATT